MNTPSQGRQGQQRRRELDFSSPTYSTPNHGRHNASQQQVPMEQQQQQQQRQLSFQAPHSSRGNPYQTPQPRYGAPSDSRSNNSNNNNLAPLVLDPSASSSLSLSASGTPSFDQRSHQKSKHSQSYFGTPQSASSSVGRFLAAVATPLSSAKSMPTSQRKKKESSHRNVTATSPAYAASNANVSMAATQPQSRSHSQQAQAQPQSRFSSSSPHHPQDTNEHQYVADSNHEPLHMLNQSAASLSRTSAKAGYLSKLGMNIPEFKRRFFVLQQTTHLHYYLSPNDTTPRGTVDMQNYQIQPMDSQDQPSDGRFRFVLTAAATAAHASDNQRNIVLEARSKEIGEEWMKYLQEEQLQYQKDQVDALTQRCQKRQAQIHELNDRLSTYTHMEKERDDAIDDANNWKEQVESLQHRLELFVKEASIRFGGVRNGKNDDGDVRTEEKKEDDDGDQQRASAIDDGYGTHRNDDSDDNEDDRENNQSRTGKLSISFDVQIESLESIYNDLHKSMTMAKSESETAQTHLKESQAKLTLTEKRMEKAEKHILKLWEENCSLRNQIKSTRKTLKQKKREKRVLVHELRAIHAMQQEQQEIEERTAQHSMMQHHQRNLADEAFLGSDAERLISELEKHVDSSIRLQEQYLSNGGITTTADNGKMSSLSSNANDNRKERALQAEQQEQQQQKQQKQRQNIISSPIRPKVLSLLDDQSSESSSDSEDGTHRDEKGTDKFDHDDDNLLSSDSDNEEEGGVDDRARMDDRASMVVAKEQSKANIEGNGDGDEEANNKHNFAQDKHCAESFSGVSSVVAENGDESSFARSMGSASNARSVFRRQTSDEIPASSISSVNDLEDIDIDIDNPSDSEQSNKMSVITFNGQATSRLSCPLDDIVETYDDSRDSSTSHEDSWRVYHLEFHTQKIGIQFCKVPPQSEKLKSRGLLTDAVKADMYHDSHDPRQSYAGGAESSGTYACPVSLPSDYVLVCGFEGFQQSSNVARPKLGARLVAFDGVSVETGQWTFDGIRRAIKSRSRPMTLSFRNDSLTPEQRNILSKALNDVDDHLVRPTTNHNRHHQYQDRNRKHVVGEKAFKQHSPGVAVQEPNYGMKQLEGLSSLRSINSHHSSSSTTSRNGYQDNMQVQNDPVLDLSSDTSSANCGKWKKRLGSSSSSSHGSAAAAQSNRQKASFQTFSETGSSVFSTSVAPLVANLMKRVTEQVQSNEKPRPSYLNRRDLPRDDQQQHKDFQSSLL